jgi:hypothetical protein
MVVKCIGMQTPTTIQQQLAMIIRLPIIKRGRVIALTQDQLIRASTRMPSGGGGGYSSHDDRHSSSWVVDDDEDYNINDNDTIDLDIMKEGLAVVVNSNEISMDGTVHMYEHRQQHHQQHHHQPQQQQEGWHNADSLDDDDDDSHSNSIESYTPLHDTVALFNLVQATLERQQREEQQRQKRHEQELHEQLVHDSLQFTAASIGSNIGLLQIKRNSNGVYLSTVLSSSSLVAQANAMQTTFMTTSIIEPLQYCAAEAAAAARLLEARLRRQAEEKKKKTTRKRRSVYRETYLSRIQDFDRDLADDELASLLQDITADPGLLEVEEVERCDDDSNEDEVLDEDEHETVPPPT